MIQEIQEYNFPSGITLYEATLNENEMGDKTITGKVKTLNQNISFNIGSLPYLIYKGEKYILNVKDPQGLKSNESLNAELDLTFEHYAIHELKRYYFFDVAMNGTTIVVNQYSASLKLSLANFITNFNNVLKYYFTYTDTSVTPAVERQRISIQLASGASHDPVEVAIDYAYIWEVLQMIYDSYEARWDMAVDANGCYTITVGGNVPVVSGHTFSYGYQGGLTKIERQVQDENIRNKIFGRGGDQNLPAYYFKQAPTGSAFASDPDYCEELASIPMTELRGKTFREYVKGWNYGKHARGSQPATPSSEWTAGYNDAVGNKAFNPIEYVKDDTSIAAYGELWGNAEGLDEIYPSITKFDDLSYGRINAVVHYENPSDIDNIGEAVQSDTTRIELPSVYANWCHGTNGKYYKEVGAGSTAHFDTLEFTIRTENFTIRTENFTVDEGDSVTLLSPDVILRASAYGLAHAPYSTQSNHKIKWGGNYRDMASSGFRATMGTQTAYFKPVNPDETHTDTPITGSVGEGEWYVEIHQVLTDVQFGNVYAINKQYWSQAVTLELVSPTLIHTQASNPARLFDIWIKDIWHSTQGASETDEAYVNRIWGPILGSANGTSASVSFQTGWMSTADYSFLIPTPISRHIHVDRTKPYIGKDGQTTYYSEWRLTLAKSDAEMETDGKYMPRQDMPIVAGDEFFFEGIEVPYEYVRLAEERIDAKKQEVLDDNADIDPQWTITLDKVRINTLESGESATLASLLATGKKITIADSRFLPNNGTRELIIESMTTTWNSETIQYPSIDIVLSKEIRTITSSIESLRSDIRRVAINSTTKEESNEIAASQVAARAVMSRGYETTESVAPTEFADNVTSSDYEPGLSGTGWGFTRNENGSKLEVDSLLVRGALTTSTIEANETKYIGGRQIISAASFVISKVVKTTVSGSNSFRCYFDNVNASVSNMFAVHDIAMAQRFDNSNTETRSYRYEVIATGTDYVDLAYSDSPAVSATPQIGDTLIQYGNTTDATRQYAIITDVIGGGCEKMLFGLNSTSATGTEYYFAGQTDTHKKRWFIGEKGNNENSYIEYYYDTTADKYVLVIGSDVYVGGGNINLSELNRLATALGDDNSQGLILANQMAVYDSNNNVKGGINGNLTNATDIAAWFGGSKSDTGDNKAKIVFRADGSGYVADGNLSWSNTGQVTINGSTAISGSGVDLSGVLTALNGKMDKLALACGSTTQPIYFDATGTPHIVTGVQVTGNIEAGGGVSAQGIVDLSISGGGGGGQGTVTAVKVGTGTAVGPDESGVVNLPAVAASHIDSLVIS